jgi:hypothetical protein
VDDHHRNASVAFSRIAEARHTRPRCGSSPMAPGSWYVRCSTYGAVPEVVLPSATEGAWVQPTFMMHPQSKLDHSFTPSGPYPAYPERLVRAIAPLRSDRPASRVEIEEFRTALCAYVHQLRAAGVSRDRLVSAVWPLFVGVASARLIDDAVDWCLNAYEVEAGSR